MPEQLGCQTNTQLRWWGDYWAYQPIIWEAVMRAWPAVAYLIISAAVGATFPWTNIIRCFPDAIAITALSCVLVFEAWSRITGTERQDPANDYARLAGAVGVSFIYGILACFGLLVFIGPGLYIMVAASLAIVFVCLEKLPVSASLEASRKLVQGNFWRTLGYLGPTYFIIAALMMATSYGVFHLAALMNIQGFAYSPFAKIFTFINSLLGSWVVLGVLPMQVKWYQQLKLMKGEPVPVLTHAANRLGMER